MNNLKGSIDHVTYYDEESYFTVATLRSLDNKPITIIGTLPSIQVGETIKCTGDWKKHPKHGMQFEVDTFEIEIPKDALSIEKFLASGAIRGIGPAYASRIVAQFGNNTLSIIDQEPDRLDEIKGLGEKRKEILIQSWKEHKTLQDVVIFLHGFGISRAFARRILRTYGNHALQKIKENPYQLAKEVNGIGFKLADKIAKNFGFAHDFTGRIQAGIDYSLFELSQEGHTTYPLNMFTKKAASMLEVEDALVQETAGRMLEKELIEIRKNGGEDLYIWSKPLFLSERGIAKEIKRLQENLPTTRDAISDKAVEWVESKLQIRFAEEQKAAIKQSLEKKVSIVTGGPGTGKSTITRAIVGIYSKLTKKILLAAPTGRAAKRLTEITSSYASTIHRILKFNFLTGSFHHDKDHPIDADLIIIDEASMIDTYLMYQLLRAIGNGTRVIIIGDANQLPSVGPGNVLKDLIASTSIPVTILSSIYRQAKGSQIIVNAHRINEGKMPFVVNTRRSDFVFVEAKTSDDVTYKILELATNKVPSNFGFDPKKEIQVLAPMKKGPCGIDILNQKLQEALLTSKVKCSFCHLCMGDKVMQIKNNYSKEVYNGDVGFVTAFDEEQKLLLVDMDGKPVSYEMHEIDDQLILAYAVSIHKYQGSECSCIIMPVHTAHFKMLNKNLLYTGVTRGKKLVVVVGTKQALAIAVKNQQVDLRYTGLRDLCTIKT